MTYHCSLLSGTMLIILIILFAFSYASSVDLAIVGGGTSGCVLAARLCTALPHAKIALLERGVPRTKSAEGLVREPRNTLPSWRSKLVSEIFTSLPDYGLHGRQNTIVTGATLGGSSAINAMQWTVPLDDTVTRWNILGLTSEVANKFYKTAYEKVGFSPQPRSIRSRYADEYVQAAVKAGFAQRFAPFDNSVRKEIWQQAVATSYEGRRIDSCSAYLTPVLEKCRNLNLMQGVTVTKILFDDGDIPRANGLEYVDTESPDLDMKKVLKVNKEVLLSAGPFGSPKLLLLSGIGPKDDLSKLDIETLVNLGVGTRTQARPYSGVTSLYTGVPLEPSNNSSVVASRKAQESWREGKPSVLGTSGFLTLAVLNKKAYSNSATALDDDLLDVPGIFSFCIGNPTSYGSLKLRDKSPLSSPEVNLNLLGNKRDMQRLKYCMKEILRLHECLPQKLDSFILSPSGGVNETFLRQSTNHAYHFVGGSRVGRVLDKRLNVKGVRGLRVIDSSVFKRIPTSAGPMSSTYMLAEYASEKLTELYGCDFKNEMVCGIRNESNMTW